MKDLILLHGALGAKSQFNGLMDSLEEDFNIHTLNFEGHGGLETDNPFSIKLFAENLHSYIEEHQLAGPYIFGYSMGGYVALYYASNGGDIDKIMTLGTKFNWTPSAAEKELKLLNPEIIKEKVPKFVAFLGALHHPLNWEINMIKTGRMMQEMGENPPLSNERLNAVKQEVLCCLGDEDNMVTPEETVLTVQQLNNAQFKLFPKTQHPLERVNIEFLKEEMRSFFM